MDMTRKAQPSFSFEVRAQVHRAVEDAGDHHPVPFYPVEEQVIGEPRDREGPQTTAGILPE